MEPTQLDANARRLRFPAPLEEQFRRDYFANSLAICRIAMAVTLVLWMAFGVLDPYVLPLSHVQVWQVRFFIVTPILLSVFLFSFTAHFQRLMQASLILDVLAGGFGLILISATAQPSEPGYSFYYAGLILIPLISYSFARMRFWSATVSNWIVVVIYIVSAVFSQDILRVPLGKTTFINSVFFIIAANVAGMGACYSLELYARRTFVANHLLQLERDEQKRKREQTESMLHVLSQAIGIIVHDLGTPLTSVQLGADTLEMSIERGRDDRENLHRITGFIKSGSQMLNFLRLSLMEQLRVLEGKPVPINREITSLRENLREGIRYQKPRFSSGRLVTIADADGNTGGDIELEIDAMRMITVWMNLIGNALKYSDGEVKISWRQSGNDILIAVADQGRSGQGITREQASQLFVAFGRLDAHKAIEGTGFGLLSAQKIVEAHGGRLWIEGYENGTPTSPLFSATDEPPMLRGDFRTAFVAKLPIKQQGTRSREQGEDYR